MRLINLDEFANGNVTGKTQILKVLDKWEKEHPLTEIVIPHDGWEITMTRKEKK